MEIEREYMEREGEREGGEVEIEREGVKGDGIWDEDEVEIRGGDR